MWSMRVQKLFPTKCAQQFQTIVQQIRFASQHTNTWNKEQQPLRYTRPDGNLTFEERQCYEKNGYILIRKLVPPESIERFRKRFEDVCVGKVQVPAMTLVKDVTSAKLNLAKTEKTITRIQDFTLDDEFFQYCCLPDLVKYVENFTGPNIMAMHTMLVNKPPDSGTKSSRHPLHQDLYFFPFRPANRIVCAWTAMEHIHPENGCLVVLPGTHKGKIEDHDYPHWEGGVNKMYYGIKNFDANQERQHLEMWTGDTIFFHPLLIHGSGINKTGGFRKVISCHYADSSCYYVECEKFQEPMSNEFRDAFRKRTGFHEATFLDLWKHRSRLVQGRRINL